MLRSVQPPMERHLQDAASHILQLDGWRYFKMEPISRREWGKGTGEKGMPDGLYIRYGEREALRRNQHQPGTMAMLCSVMWIEWKRRGRKPKPHQIAWHLAERARGGFVACAGVDFEASLEGFLEWYEASGLCRRRLSERP